MFSACKETEQSGLIKHDQDLNIISEFFFFCLRAPSRLIVFSISFFSGHRKFHAKKGFTCTKLIQKLVAEEIRLLHVNV